MSRVCEICGKGPSAGNTIARSGMKKIKGGIGLHITGVTKRRFIPNIHKIRVKENGGTIRRKVCASCIKGGKIVKA